jgi:hypothetical protein
MRRELMVRYHIGTDTLCADYWLHGWTNPDASMFRDTIPAGWNRIDLTIQADSATGFVQGKGTIEFNNQRVGHFDYTVRLEWQRAEWLYNGAVHILEYRTLFDQDKPVPAMPTEADRLAAIEAKLDALIAWTVARGL